MVERVRSCISRSGGSTTCRERGGLTSTPPTSAIGSQWANPPTYRATAVRAMMTAARGGGQSLSGSLLLVYSVLVYTTSRVRVRVRKKFPIEKIIFLSGNKSTNGHMYQFPR